jgi:hypothetical protein
MISSSSMIRTVGDFPVSKPLTITYSKIILKA